MEREAEQPAVGVFGRTVWRDQARYRHGTPVALARRAGLHRLRDGPHHRAIFWSWSGNNIKLEEILSEKSHPSLISKWSTYNWGGLAQECWDGKYEQYCVWRRKEEVKPFWIVWCPEDKNFPISSYPSRAEAVEKAESLAESYSNENRSYYVLRAECKIQCHKKVTKTEFEKD